MQGGAEAQAWNVGQVNFPVRKLENIWNPDCKSDDLMADSGMDKIPTSEGITTAP